MTETRLHKISDREPVFPCFLWNADCRAWIYATNESVFLPCWRDMYSHWYEPEGDHDLFPTEEPN